MKKAVFAFLIVILMSFGNYSVLFGEERTEPKLPDYEKKWFCGKVVNYDGLFDRVYCFDEKDKPTRKFIAKGKLRAIGWVADWSAPRPKDTTYFAIWLEDENKWIIGDRGAKLEVESYPGRKILEFGVLNSDGSVKARTEIPTP